MTNERLRARLVEAGMSSTDLAAVVEVDPKTVERWVCSGRTPHQRHRRQAAKALGTDEVDLWPQLLGHERMGTDSRSEVMGVYPTRGDVPQELWRRLIDDATSNIDVLVYSGLFLLDNNPGLPAKLIERAAAGLEGRFLYGKPDSQPVAWRGKEEGIGENLAARIRLSLTYMQPVIGIPGLEIRQHETVLYNSIYRFDDELLVNTHVGGSPASQNPVIHLKQVEEETFFGQYMASFEHVWASAIAPCSHGKDGLDAQVDS